MLILFRKIPPEVDISSPCAQKHNKEVLFSK